MPRAASIWPYGNGDVFNGSVLNNGKRCATSASVLCKAVLGRNGLPCAAGLGDISERARLVKTTSFACSSC